jgi:hypothetical protein
VDSVDGVDCCNGNSQILSHFFGFEGRLKLTITMPHDKVTRLNLRDVDYGTPQVKVWMHDLIQFLIVTQSAL